MTGPTSRFWLAARSATFALVTAYLSALGHLLGGGGLPDLGTLLFAAALVGGTVSGVARTRRGVVPIIGMVLVAQLAYHLLFTLDAHHAGPLDLPRMLAFHAVAGVLCAVVLARGDRALFALFDALRRAFRSAFPTRLPVRGAVAIVVAPVVPALAGRRCPGAPRRGPPA